VVACIFAKPPRAGEVKTRLIPALGPTGAAALAEAFLVDTLATVRSVPGLLPVLATTAPWAREDLEVWQQGEGDLGARLERILRQGLARHPAALALGADSPGLPAAFLAQAVELLSTHDAVVGPTDDGGYYLLGVTRCPEGLLADLPWSAPTTCAATMARLSSHGFRVARLPPYFDVDTPEDLRRLQVALARGDVTAPATRTALEGRLT
jgi:rSAM/selenodomain-associated transferase 1